MSQQLNNLPPQALDLEEAVLGAIMIEAGAIGTVVDRITPEVFYKQAHQHIYAACLELYEKSQPIDLLTVTQQCRVHGTIESIGGPSTVLNITNKVSSTANLEYHTSILLEAFIKRSVISLCNKNAAAAYDPAVDPFSLLDTIGAGLSDLLQGTLKKGPKKANNVLEDLLNEVQERMKAPEGITGVPSGIKAVDNVIQGWQPSDLIILAARPGMGKTAFMLSVCRNAAIDYKKPALIFSLEMKDTQLMARLAAMDSGISSQTIQKHKLGPDTYSKLVGTTGALASSQIYIDDTPGINILDLRARARRLWQKVGISLIVVDYLQLMEGGGPKKYSSSNREQEISSISRALKHLAKELNVPVIALSQLSRAVETRGGERKPQLSDLRESGSIEQDADIVGFLYRPEYYNISQDEEGHSTEGYAELLIKKHRNGGLADIGMRFIKEETKFTDYVSAGQFPAAF